jgi:hypothetical protein
LKLPIDTTIAPRKVEDYLLHFRLENDKSAFLALAGYTSGHTERLLADLREQILPLEAECID